MAPGSSYQFGPFRLNSESRVLSRDGNVVSLAPRTFDLLLVFVTSTGRLLTKDELLRLIWGDVNVEEASLAFQVSMFRKALGEYGTTWIETVPKHGYRFTADVEAGVAGVAGRVQAPLEAQPQVAPRPQARNRIMRAVGAICIAVAAVAGTITLNRPTRSSRDSMVNIRPLTSYPGAEVHPSLSPDGAQVAFSWEGEPTKDPDIYIQLIGQGSPVPLTVDPRPEYSPSWSPDGRLIAFCRQTVGNEIRMDSG